MKISIFLNSPLLKLGSIIRYIIFMERYFIFAIRIVEEKNIFFSLPNDMLHIDK